MSTLILIKRLKSSPTPRASLFGFGDNIRHAHNRAMYLLSRGSFYLPFIPIDLVSRGAANAEISCVHIVFLASSASVTLGCRGKRQIVLLLLLFVGCAC